MLSPGRARRLSEHCLSCRQHSVKSRNGLLPPVFPHGTGCHLQAHWVCTHRQDTLWQVSFGATFKDILKQCSQIHLNTQQSIRINLLKGLFHIRVDFYNSCICCKSPLNEYELRKSPWGWGRAAAKNKKSAILKGSREEKQTQLCWVAPSASDSNPISGIQGLLWAQWVSRVGQVFPMFVDWTGTEKAKEAGSQKCSTWLVHRQECSRAKAEEFTNLCRASSLR